MSLIERINARLEAVGKSPQGASVEAGLGRDFIRNVERGTVKEPKGSSLVLLARALETSVLYLLEVTDDPDPRIIERTGTARLMVRYGVKAGVWHDRKASREVERPCDLAPNMAFPATAQWAAELLDDSLQALGHPPGCVLHCIDVEAIDYAPQPGAIVIVTRTRGGELDERTARLVMTSAAGLNAATRPLDDRRAEQTAILPAADGVRVTALVIAVLHRAIATR